MDNKKICKISFKNCVGNIISIVFTECESPCFKYGNRTAIDIDYSVNGKKEFWPEFIDCRYIIDYDFFNTCKDYVLDRWENITDLQFNIPLVDFLK